MTRATPPPDVDVVERAAAALGDGLLVALPTETVYGLGADASNEVAVRRIFAVKGRPVDHPLIVHLADPAAIDDWAIDVSDSARRLAEAFWPGPLTLLVRRAPHVLDVVTGGRPTVGLRVPAHPLTLAILRTFGGGVAAPSANRFGRVSPTTAAHVAEDLGDDVDLIVDGGHCDIGVESTIVDATVDPPQILRPGGIDAVAIEGVLAAHLAAPSGESRAPGMLESHYAPHAAVIPVDSLAEARTVEAALTDDRRPSEIVDVSGDANLAARTLYDHLRRADRHGVVTLIIVQPSNEGIGAAVRDRLRKAAAPR
jgi:L-threonylcarbamoyladenylate synthase